MFGSKKPHYTMNAVCLETQSSDVSCSICLELVVDTEERSKVKLCCGHEFHLDCIGSAFNVKGEMQCPNCRNIENGRWLYGNGSSRTLPEYSTEEWHNSWTPDEEPYDVAFPELPFRFPWMCPFGVARVISSFEEVEAPTASYHDLQEQQSIYAEQTAGLGSSVSHSYVEFDDTDGLTSLHAFPPLNLLSVQTRNEVGNQVNGSDVASNQHGTRRSTHGEFESVTRSGAYTHPFVLGHGPGTRDGTSSYGPSMEAYQPSRSRHERIHRHVLRHHQLLQQRHNASSSNMPPTFFPPGPRGGGYNGPINLSHSTENHFPIHTHLMERDYLSRFPSSSIDRGDSGSGWESSSHHQGNASSSDTIWQWP